MDCRQGLRNRGMEVGGDWIGIGRRMVDVESRCRFAKWFQGECWIRDEWSIRRQEDREVGEGI